MSDQIFPSLPGLRWEQKKTPLFITRIQRAASGTELRLSQFVYPLYQYDLSYEILRDNTLNNELKTLMGFYLSRQGAYDSFLYIDPSDNTVVGQQIGTGNGVTAAFQLVRTYGGFTEPCLDIQAPGVPVLHVYVGYPPVLQDPSYYDIKASDGTVSYFNGGILTFKAGHIPGYAGITASFSYYKRVRFVEYQEDGSPGGGGSAFNQFMYRLWELQSLSFVTCR